MPVLEINEDEKKLLLIALVHDRVRLMHEWAQIGDDDGRIDPDGDRWVIDGIVDAMTDLRRKIEAADDAPKAAWHHERGWLHPKKAMEAAKADVEAGDLTREEVADALGVDFAEVDAQIASIRDRLDRFESESWTTLPEDADDLMFDITDPEEKIVIASGDTQTDGTVVGFHTFTTEADNAVSKGIWALITRNFSLASDRDMKLAEKALMADPERLAAIKSSVEDLQKALAQDGKDNWPIDPILGSWASRLDPADADRIDISFNGEPRCKAVVQKSISPALLEDIQQAVHASIARLENE